MHEPWYGLNFQKTWQRKNDAALFTCFLFFIFYFFFLTLNFPVILARNGLQTAPKTAPCKVSRIPESDKFLVLESGILGFGILSGCPQNDCTPSSASQPISVFSRTLLFSEVDLTLACENSRFSSLIAAGDLSRGGASATRRQKFHTDDVNQCLHNKSGSHGVPKANVFNFTFPLVDFGKVLCSCGNQTCLETSSSKTQMLLLEKNEVQKYSSLFCYRFIAFTFDLCSLLSFVCHS